MKLKELEKMYSRLKMDETLIDDLCAGKDERVFKYAKDSMEKLYYYQEKDYKDMENIVQKNEESYSNSKDPSVFTSFKNELKQRLNILYSDILSSLKKMYIND